MSDKFKYFSAVAVPSNAGTRVCWRENVETGVAEDVLCETIPDDIEVIDLTYYEHKGE